jgi:hypothetical protein
MIRRHLRTVFIALWAFYNVSCGHLLLGDAYYNSVTVRRALELEQLKNACKLTVPKGIRVNMSLGHREISRKTTGTFKAGMLVSSTTSFF